MLFKNVPKCHLTKVLDQEHLRNIKNNLHFFEQNDLINIGLNIPKSFFLNLNHYLIFLFDVLKLAAFKEDLFNWAQGKNIPTIGAVILKN